MATGTQTDLVIYEDEFYGGFNETLRQNTEAFNQASGNAIQLIPEGAIGNFKKEAFIQNAFQVRRRDPDSTSTGTSDKLSSDDVTMPKLYRYHMAEENWNALANIAADEDDFSFWVGEQVAKERTVDYLDTLLLIANTCLQQTTSGGPTGSGAYFDATGESTSTLTTSHLIDGLARMGDASEDIVLWAMHSVPFYDLMEDQKGIEIDSVAGETIAQGSVSTLGIPVLRTDSSSLKNSGAVSSSSDIYQVLGLTAGAVAALESRADEIPPFIDRITGGENILARIQGEYAYNVTCKGYDFTSSTKNPNDAALASTGNWNNVYNSSVKDGPGILIEVTG